MATQRDIAIREMVLRWGATALRDLPWRHTRDPWAILVAETMLQQTQVSLVTERFPRFLARFPTVEVCAAAPAGDVIDEWAGLGYNRRARYLHGAAATMVERHGGRVPHDLDHLLALPGVGPYTARAVLAFAHELPAAVLDTNVGRVLARLDGRSFTPRGAQDRADRLAPPDRPWSWNQAVIELGALLCTKRAPRCGECPVRRRCAWQGVGPDPAAGSAGASAPQSRFEGSDRQLRGRLVDAMRRGPVGRDAVSALLGEREGPVVAGLVRDGLAVEDRGFLRLP